jgi:hypothetical protein
MSDYGSRIVSASGGRQIDNKRMVPQLIAVLWAGDYPSFDSPAQGGWVYRQWNYPIPSAALNRPYVVFFSVPFNASETYYFGDPAGAGCIYSPGSYVEPPTIYYFALDYVSYGSERYGKRVWGPGGQLLYDSGNRHLNINQVFTGLNPDMAWSGREAVMTLNGWGAPKGYMPQSPALSIDSRRLHEHWGDKSGTGEAKGRLFYRVVGNGGLQSIFCRYFYQFDPDTTSNAPYSGLWRSSGLNNAVMVLDRWQHDV